MTNIVAATWRSAVKYSWTGARRETNIILYMTQFLPPSPHGATAASGPAPPYYRGFTITLGDTIVGRTTLCEWSARRWGLYFTNHNSDQRQTSMPKERFESEIPPSERLQIDALERAGTGIITSLSSIGTFSEFSSTFSYDASRPAQQ